MPSLLDSCEKYFDTRDLYAVLNVSKNASDKQVRKAYHKLSLIVHPDRVDENKKLEATEKFKVLGHVHSILSNEEKRKVYDETGDCGEDSDELTDRDWSAYWQSCFKEITVKDINEYEKKYKGSDEELQDLKNAYLHGKGSMDWILEAVPFTNTDEEDRLRERLKPLMDSGEIPVYKRFTNENPKKVAARKRKYEKEAKEAEKLAAELGLEKKLAVEDEEDGLKAIIKARQGQRLRDSENFLDRLAEKYAAKATKKKVGTKSKK